MSHGARLNGTRASAHRLGAGIAIATNLDLEPS